MEGFFPEGQRMHTPSNMASIRTLFALSEGMESQKILEARAIMCDSDHNLFVELGGELTGIIPREEGAIGIREGTTRDIAIISRVNKPVAFVVQEIDYGNKRAILSRRKAQEICQTTYLDQLLPGQIISGRITHMESFGCFVDVGCGISSLLPIDNISVSRIAHPRDRFTLGQNIFALVESNAEGRICLSHKELLGTWTENAALFASGQTVSGIIRSVESYGVFVELTPNLAGLAEPFSGAEVGQHASVFIKSLIPEKMKVKLIIIDAFSADYPPSPLTYFQKEGQIQEWIYSPPNCTRCFRRIF